MGLIYSSSDSVQLIQGLKSNIERGKEIVKQLKSGSQKIVSAVDGKTLAGATYTAGKGLFADCVIPMINRTTSAFDKIEYELSKYQIVDAEISGEGYLDEDSLRRLIAAKQAMKTSVEVSAAVARTLARNNPVAGVLSFLLNVQNSLRSMSNSLEADIQKLKKKLDTLDTFSSKTSRLFSNSSSDFKLAMQSVLVLNSTTVTVDGTYSFSNGIDNSWFSSIKATKGSKDYDREKEIKDFLDGTTPSEFSKKALSGLLSKIQKKVITERKNIGKSWAGKKIKEGVDNVGKALSNSVQPLTKVFS